MNESVEDNYSISAYNSVVNFCSFICKDCSLCHVLILFFLIKSIVILVTWIYTPSNVFRAYIILVVKLEHNLQNQVTCKTRQITCDYHV